IQEQSVTAGGRRRVEGVPDAPPGGCVEFLTLALLVHIPAEGFTPGEGPVDVQREADASRGRGVRAAEEQGQMEPVCQRALPQLVPTPDLGYGHRDLRQMRGTNRTTNRTMARPGDTMLGGRRNIAK